MTTERQQSKAAPETSPFQGRSPLVRALLHILMRLQSRTLPCMSWQLAEAQKTEAETVGRERGEKG